MDALPVVETLLSGAYDIHVHCAPDVVPRAQDLAELAAAARQAGMAGVLLKDHTTCTAGRAYVLNRIQPAGPRFLSALVLNPPVGGLNPLAVEVALRNGSDVIYFPTYAARHQIAIQGMDGFPPAYPLPGGGFEGIDILDAGGAPKPEVTAILGLIARYDAVLATGHISPREILVLLQAAQRQGVERTIVTHASAPVPGMSIAQQREAVRHGAFVEYCLLALVNGALSAGQLVDQIRQVGAERVILSSDLGQATNGPVVAGFARQLQALRRAGLTDGEVRTTIRDNPGRLLERSAHRG